MIEPSSPEAHLPQDEEAGFSFRLDRLAARVDALASENQQLRQQLQAQGRLLSGRILGVHLAEIAGETAKEPAAFDAAGRVMIKMLFDNAQTEMKANVASPWLADSGGVQFSLRVGQQVLVAFLEGNPASPWIIGHAPIGQSALPYDPTGEAETLYDELEEGGKGEKTENKYKTIIASASPEGTRSEIAFVDEPGKESLSLASQGHLHIKVEGESKEEYGGEYTKVHWGGVYENFAGLKEETFEGNLFELHVGGVEHIYLGEYLDLKVLFAQEIFLGWEVSVKLASATEVHLGTVDAFSDSLVTEVKISGGVELSIGVMMECFIGGKVEVVLAAESKIVEGEGTTVIEGIETTILNGYALEVINGVSCEIVDGTKLSQKTVIMDDGEIVVESHGIEQGACQLEMKQSLIDSGEAAIRKQEAALTTIA